MLDQCSFWSLASDPSCREDWLTHYWFQPDNTDQYSALCIYWLCKSLQISTLLSLHNGTLVSEDQCSALCRSLFCSVQISALVSVDQCYAPCIWVLCYLNKSGLLSANTCSAPCSALLSVEQCSSVCKYVICFLSAYWCSTMQLSAMLSGYHMSNYLHIRAVSLQTVLFSLYMGAMFCGCYGCYVHTITMLSADGCSALSKLVACSLDISCLLLWILELSALLPADGCSALWR